MSLLQDMKKHKNLTEREQDVLQGTGACDLHKCGIGDEILPEAWDQRIPGIQASAGKRTAIWNSRRRDRNHVRAGECGYNGKKGNTGSEAGN